MIIDVRAHPEQVGMYDILDAGTGEVLRGMSAWYADDATGELRVYRKDAKGCYIVGGDEVVWETIHRPIRIVSAGWRPTPAETWRDRPALL